MILKEGVNLAMTDALKLAEALISSSGSDKDGAVDSAVQAFEEAMFLRAAVIAEVTKGNMEDLLFSAGVNEQTAARYVRRALLGEKPCLEKLIPLWFVRFVLRIYFKW